MGQRRPFPAQTVLVVEDDPLLRMMAVDLVEDAGFNAVEASGADEALDILATRPDVKVLFTDIDMPGTMNGVALAKTACESGRMISVVLTSGNHLLDDDDLPPRSVFFAKPYDFGQVTATLKRLAA